MTSNLDENASSSASIPWRFALATAAFVAGMLLYTLYLQISSQPPVAEVLGAEVAEVGAASRQADANLEGGSSETGKPWQEDEGIVDPTIATPSLEPHEVVQLQLESLRASRDDNSLLAACYSLASPQNRRETGPFTRFSAMVRQPPYNALIHSQDWQIGTTLINGSIATVLVTLTRGDDDVRAFRFVLERQTETPYVGCWMTAIVQPVNLLPSAETSSKSTAISSKGMSLEVSGD